MAKVETFEYKLAGMRKPDRWIVYPRGQGNDCLTVQGRRAIALVNLSTGKGVLNWRGSNSKYFVHLATSLGAEPFLFPAEFVAQAVEFEPKSGDLIGTSSVTGPIYIA